MDCSQRFVENNFTYDVIQNTVQGCLLFYILGLNLSTIGATLYGGILYKCPISKVMLSSYFGNFVRGFSFFLNEIYYSQNGTPMQGCNVGLDRYYLLYFGTMVCMTTLILNSYTIHNGIVNNSWLISTHKVTAKTFIVLWFISGILSTVFTIIETSYPKLQFYKVTAVSAILILISLCFYMRILCSLATNERNDAVNREESLDKIHRAKLIIQINLFSYIGLLIVGTIFNVIADAYKKESVHLAMIWLLRITYSFMFSLEAHVLLYKTPNILRCR